MTAILILLFALVPLEEKLISHSVKHIASGDRVVLGGGRKARTVRFTRCTELTMFRNLQGEVVSVTLKEWEVDEHNAIPDSTFHKQSASKEQDRLYLVERFFRRTGLGQKDVARMPGGEILVPLPWYFDEKWKPKDEVYLVNNHDAFYTYNLFEYQVLLRLPPADQIPILTKGEK